MPEKYPKDGFHVIDNGEDFQVQRYRGHVVCYCETLSQAEEYCRILNAVRRRVYQKPEE